MEVIDNAVTRVNCTCRQTSSLLERKGIGLIFPTQPWDNVSFGHKRGNANELGDVGKSSWKSSLFFVRSLSHGM